MISLGKSNLDIDRERSTCQMVFYKNLTQAGQIILIQMGQYQYAGQLFCQNSQSRRSTQRVLAQVYIEAQMRVWLSVQIH